MLELAPTLKKCDPLRTPLKTKNINQAPPLNKHPDNLPQERKKSLNVSYRSRIHKWFQYHENLRDHRENRTLSSTTKNFCFFTQISPSLLLQYCGIFEGKKLNNKWNDMCGENTEKNSEFQMGIEPTTFRTLVGCSNHWATENSVGSRSVVRWHNYRIAQSHYVKWTHNINCIVQSRI